MKNSLIVSSIISFFLFLKNKLKESNFYNITKNIDSFLRKTLRNSLFVYIFSEKDNFDEQYKERLNFKNKVFHLLKKCFNWVYNLFENSILVSELRIGFGNFYKVNLKFYGYILSVLGIFSVLNSVVIYKNKINFIISFAVFIFGIIFRLINDNINNIISKSYFLGNIIRFFKDDYSEIDVLFVNNKTGTFLGLILGIVSLKFGIIPTIISLLAVIMIFFAFENLYVFLALSIFALPFLPTMAMVGLSLLAVMILLFKKLFYSSEFTENNSILNFFTVIYLFAVIFGTVFSFNKVASLKIALVYISFVLIYYVIVNVVNTTEKTVTAVMGIALFSIPVSAYGIIQKIIGFDEQNTWIDQRMFEDISGRVVSFFENPNVFGEYLIWIVILSVFAFMASKTYKTKIIFASSIILSFLSMIYTYSRGCWIGLLAAVIIYLFMTNKKSFWLFVCVGIVALFFLPASIVERVSSIGNLADTSTSYRVYIWKGTIEMLKDYWVTGVGLGTDAFNCVYPAYAYSAIVAPHPHNLYLLIMSETGLIGILSFALIVITYLRNLFKLYRYTKNQLFKKMSAAFSCAMIGYLIQGMFDNVWYNYRIYYLFWVFVALGTAVYLVGKRESNYD